MLTEYTMQLKKIITTPKTDAIIPSGVFGKPFVCGAFIFNNMKEIKLSRGLFAYVDDEDYEWLNKYTWATRVDGVRRRYAITHTPRIGGKQGTVFMHTLILNPPNGMVTDHIDGNGLNNQRYNLRSVTHSQNMMNRSPKKEYKGVHREKKYGYIRSYIRVNGEVYYAGHCTTIEQAAKRYDALAQYYYGEYARLNFESIKKGE